MKPPHRSPSFFIVGAARGGTTSLHYYLQSQPGVTMSAVKEPNFFALGNGGHDLDLHPDALAVLLSSSVTDPDEYDSLFSSAMPGDLLGEASPLYLFSPSAAKAIADHSPGAKIVVVLRDPVDRAYSSFLRRSDADRTPRGFLSEMEREVGGQGTGESHHPIPLVAGGQYSRQLLRYLKRFDRASIWVGLSEALWGQPSASLMGIWEFLDPPAPAPTGELPRFNASSDVRHAAVDTLIRRPVRVKRFLKRRVPGIAGRLVGVKHRIQDWNSEEAPTLPIAYRRIVFERYFENDVRALDAIVDLDLSRWAP